MDFLGTAATLLQTLYDVVKTAEGNKEQCLALHERASRIVKVFEGGWMHASLAVAP